MLLNYLTKIRNKVIVNKKKTIQCLKSRNDQQMIKICEEIDDKTDQKTLIEESFNDILPEQKVEYTKNECINDI